MDIEKWHDRFVTHLQKQGGLTKIEAEDTLAAGMGEYDYYDNPEDTADDEMNYWTNDD